MQGICTDSLNIAVARLPMKHERPKWPPSRNFACWDATRDGAQCGLETLLRRYVIRNTKEGERRQYFFVNKRGDDNVVYELAEFKKLDDLRQRVEKSPLIPFEGTDALYYLGLRTVIQDKAERSLDGTITRSFVTVEMQEGLSSFHQISSSALLNGGMDREPVDSAKWLKATVDGWIRRRRLHPKVRAASDIIADITRSEVQKLELTPEVWLSKILVFNKAIKGTAEHLRKVIEPQITTISMKLWR